MTSPARIRVSGPQLCGVALLSALATAGVLASTHGRTPAQLAALAALRRPPVVVRLAARAPVSAPLPASSPSPAPSPAASSSPTAANTQSPAPSFSPAQTSPSTTPTSVVHSAPAKVLKVGHVFVIALSTTSYDAAFGPGSVAHYLNGTLRRQGTLLGGYETLGGSELPDYLAMISGQAPNADTTAGCSSYTEFPAGAKPAGDGQVPGTGCVYPNTVLTIGDQATASGRTWKAYIGDMGQTSCVHPNSGAPDDTPLPGAGADYDTRHNPFIYFHSLLDLGGCASDDVSLNLLPGDLHTATRTPSYAFIAPQACLDASAQPCPNGQPAGLAGEDAFLRRWVPRILRSTAYRRDGLLIVAFALASSDAAGAGSSPGTAAANPEPPAPSGALVLSPHTPHGKIISETYNAYSLLRSVEDLLGYKPLARAKTAKSFVAKVLT